MSPYEPDGAAPGPAAPGGPRADAGEGRASDDESAPDSQDEAGASEEAEQNSEESDRPQKAWDARRDLMAHSPAYAFGDTARFGGSLVNGDQTILPEGNVTGDVILGTKTVIHQTSFFGAGHASGEIPRESLERMAGFVVTDGPAFENALQHLRRDRFVVLSGPHFTGRRTAALMLLHRLGVSSVRALDRSTSPGDVAHQLEGGGADSVHGHVLCDLVTGRDLPLREPHLLAARDKLTEQSGYLVITVGPNAALEDIDVVKWRPPPADAVLHAHLLDLTRDVPELAPGQGTVGRVKELEQLPAVVDFLSRDHQLREVAAFARILADHARGKVSAAKVTEFSLATLENQVQEWFDDPATHLRDKAFLISLAAFNEGPYALTAELSDLLYTLLQKTEGGSSRIPVFGTSIDKRLQLARARLYEQDEATEWGPVPQSKAAYVDERASLVLLREVWTGHPSSRPAFVNWLRRLADDGRPLVRNRAAVTVAVLTVVDLPSAMALVIEPWATDKLYRRRLAAASSLVLAHYLDAPNVLRILDGWCADEDDERLRWTAIRAYALLGPAEPEAALTALRATARRRDRPGTDTDSPAYEEEAAELASALELLLLSRIGVRVLPEISDLLRGAPSEHELALRTFLGACGRIDTSGEDATGRPLLMEWFGRTASEGGRDAHTIAALWRAALNDRGYTTLALDRFADWVRIADRDPTAEWELASLLALLATADADRRRLAHLLRTMPGERGGPPPPVTTRLLTVVGPAPR
ncbi:hypothetical protein [Streptomyces sp. IB2014 016-6]|uniref:hypothetical protein n=1 Tax=Streptomyces sp. IB2014 016-6 TaxID=2517818 RepID=UPI0011C9310F|nr:hypothetical protein [Streptomyces sp. IB2014 016-6]TXL90362.1 hypothetical protein EW053_11010 [Streptomyces sp. IB2014 016-6]